MRNIDLLNSFNDIQHYWLNKFAFVTTIIFFSSFAFYSLQFVKTGQIMFWSGLCGLSSNRLCSITPMHLLIEITFIFIKFNHSPNETATCKIIQSERERDWKKTFLLNCRCFFIIFICITWFICQQMWDWNFLWNVFYFLEHQWCRYRM